MLNLTELRKHLQENPTFTLTPEAALKLINIAKAAKKSDGRGSVNLRVLLEDVEIGDE